MKTAPLIRVGSSSELQLRLAYEAADRGNPYGATFDVHLYRGAPRPVARRPLPVEPRNGNCFEYAYCYVVDDPRWSLVHGTTVGFDNAGGVWHCTRVAHAWLTKGVWLYDPVIDATAFATEYTRAVKAEAVKTYTAWEAAKKFRSTKHTGPWAPPLLKNGVFRKECP
jgi:hypothetical protein